MINLTFSELPSTSYFTSSNDLSSPSQENLPERRNAVAQALAQVRFALAQEDCQSAPRVAQSAIFTAGREIAEIIGLRHHDGLCAFFDGEILELIVDNLGKGKRLSLEYNPTSNQYRLCRVALTMVTNTEWTRRPYVLRSEVEWLFE